ncbi:MAG: hypothetical protein QW456_09395 [Ignisphaera sp.]
MSESQVNTSGAGVYKLDVDIAVRFLQGVWLYTSPDARCFSVVVIKEGIRYKHFCLESIPLIYLVEFFWIYINHFATFLHKL